MMSSASSYFIIVFILRILKIKPDIIAHLFKKYSGGMWFDGIDIDNGRENTMSDQHIRYDNIHSTDPIPICSR